jgi:hypothetical protein
MFKKCLKYVIINKMESKLLIIIEKLKGIEVRLNDIENTLKIMSDKKSKNKLFTQDLESEPELELELEPDETILYSPKK